MQIGVQRPVLAGTRPSPRARSPANFWLEWLGGAATARLLGTPQRVRRLCETSGVEVAAVCGPNVALDLDGPSQQINKRRIEFAAELGVKTFMTKGPGREGRNGTDAELDQMAAAYEDLAAYGANLALWLHFIRISITSSIVPTSGSASWVA